MTDDSISDEDKDLFRSQMRAVKPLQKNTKRASSPDPKPVEKKYNKAHGFIPSQIPLSDYIKETVLSETILCYSTPEVPSKRLYELKNGLIPWQARLDLHGTTIEEARQALNDFIQIQTQNQHRCVLIIHGKGGHLGKPPVIKNQINRWLPQFEEVLAFHSAKPKDGGFGAVYVLLKKQ